MYADPERGIGVEAFTDGYAFDLHERVYMLSVAGHDSSVKAVTAALVSGRPIDVVADRTITLTKPYGEHYRVLSSKLPSAFLHQMVVSPRFSDAGEDGQRLIYIGEGEEADAILYEVVRGSYAVPLIPEWSRWLQEKLADVEALGELSGTRRVLTLDADEELLDELISEGVATGEISF